MPQASSVMKKWMLALSAVACMGLSVAQAQDQDQYQDQSQDQSQDQNVDPPSRVARVNLLEGTASLLPAGSDTWVDDLINRPLTNGDKLWVEDSSRAEMHLGSTAIRMGARTGVQLLAVDDERVQIKMTAGSVNVRIRELDRDERYEIQTPNVTIALLRVGEYRIESDNDGGLTELTAYSGRAEVQGNNRYTTVNAGQRGIFDSSQGNSTSIQRADGRDDFDRWAQDRNDREDNSPSARYVSRDVIGYDDLDGYGDWQSVSDYGPVWYPRVAVDWAPYHYGRWAWVAPWGWSWIDEQPWGFAPCHYGRWVRYGGRWGWAPGPRVVTRPVYAPALVAWVGGASFGVNVGWFPLGYNEIYQPGYRVSPRYIRNINRSNTTINVTVINNYINQQRASGAPGTPGRRYAHQGVPGAVAAVSRDDFAAQRPVDRHLLPVAQRQAASAPASTRPLAQLPQPVGRGIVGRQGGGPEGRGQVNRGPGPALAPARAPFQGAQPAAGQAPATGQAPGRTFNDRPATSPDARRIPEDRRGGFGGGNGLQQNQQQQPRVQQQPAQQSPVQQQPSVQQPPVQQQSPTRQLPTLPQQNNRPQQNGPQQNDRSQRTQEFQAPQRTPEVQRLPVQNDRPAVNQQRQINQPPARVDQPPRVEPPQRVEQPQRVQQPPVQQPQRVEQPRVEQPPPRVEQPRVELSRPQPVQQARPPQRQEPAEKDRERRKDKDQQ